MNTIFVTPEVLAALPDGNEPKDARVRLRIALASRGGAPIALHSAVARDLLPTYEVRLSRASEKGAASVRDLEGFVDQLRAISGEVLIFTVDVGGEVYFGLVDTKQRTILSVVTV
ncbi:hypothetical protein GCM10023221_15900 [Luteimicrobium xylanilyticum]